MRVTSGRVSAACAVAVAALLAGGCGSSSRAGSTPPDEAVTLYVDRDSQGGLCSDGRSAGEARSPSAPWCSLSPAVEAAPSGATVLVRAGTYPLLEIEDDHTRTTSVTFRPYGSEQVQIDGISIDDASRLRFERFRITGGVEIDDRSERIDLVGNDLSRHGVQMRSVRAVVVARNRIHDLAPRAGDGTCSCGIAARSSRNVGEVVDVTIRGNTITNLSGDAIHVSGGRGIVIEGNTITDARHVGDGDHVDAIQLLGVHGLVIHRNEIRRTQHGIVFTDRAAPGAVIANNVVAETSYGINAGDIPGARIVNNTFWNNRWGAVLIRDDLRTPAIPNGIVFANNIIDSLHADRSLFAVHDYNLIARGDMYGPRDRRRAPVFVNPKAGDFTLAPRSPGIDAGTSNGAPIRDARGRRRRDDPSTPNTGGGSARYYDIGAFER